MGGGDELIDLEAVGKIVAFAGLIVAAIGTAMFLMGRFGISLRPLPGDVMVRRPDFTFYFPLVSCLLLSLVVTAIMYAIALLRR